MPPWVAPSRLVLVGLVLVGLATPPSAFAQNPPTVQDAQPAVHDLQLWTQVVATVNLSDKWLTHHEAQSRWSEDIHAPRSVDHPQRSWPAAVAPRHALGRACVGAALAGDRLEPRAAHLAAALRDVPRRLAHGLLSIRIRQEQRFLDSWGDASHRLRMMGRAVRPVDSKKLWSIVAWNEIMFTLDDTQNGPAQGLDQNRVFAGVLRKLSNQAGFESGYLWRTSDPAGAAPRRHDHVLFAWLNLTF